MFSLSLLLFMISFFLFPSFVLAIFVLIPHYLPLVIHLSFSGSCFLPCFLTKSPADKHLLPLLPCRVEAAGYQRVLQVDLEVNGLMVIQGGREVTWQVEYPLTRTLTSEVPTLIRLAPQDLGGIVPLAMVRKLTAYKHLFFLSVEMMHVR